MTLCVSSACPASLDNRSRVWPMEIPHHLACSRFAQDHIDDPAASGVRLSLAAVTEDAGIVATGVPQGCRPTRACGRRSTRRRSPGRGSRSQGTSQVGSRAMDRNGLPKMSFSDLSPSCPQLKGGACHSFLVRQSLSVVHEFDHRPCDPMPGDLHGDRNRLGECDNPRPPAPLIPSPLCVLGVHGAFS